MLKEAGEKDVSYRKSGDLGKLDSHTHLDN